MRRVSTPPMAAMPRAASQRSRWPLLRQFEGSVIGARVTMPRACGVSASMSSSLVPTLPMCGKVKVTIWPA